MIEAAWYPDPLVPTRRRWWDGWRWTARVSETSGPAAEAEPTAIHWTPGPVTLVPDAGGRAVVGEPARIQWSADPIEPGPEAGASPAKGEADGIHWTPGLAELGRPEPAREAPRRTEPILVFQPVAAAPAPAAEESEAVPAVALATAMIAAPTSDADVWARLAVAAEEPDAPALSGFAADPMVPAIGDELRLPAPGPEAERPSRRRLVTALAAAAVVAIVGAAVAGAGVLVSREQRPQVVPELAYRDGDAGFSLRYPDDWRVLRRDRGDEIRFAIAARGAPTTATNTVSVVVGTEAAELPALHTLADQLTETLRADLPGVRLDEAARARVADAPGFRLSFRDPDSSPSTRIEQYVGRTATGRPLTVTVTIREPRTAPSARETREFLASLQTG